MNDRRLVGIDLGITSAHSAAILTGEGTLLARRRCVPSVDSLARLETDALKGAAAGTRLEVVIEPTGPAWLPVAVFFIRRGHTVFRVSSAKAAALRRFYARHAKSNRIDALVLARLPLIDPDGMSALTLPDAATARLRRRVRAADRLTEEITARKQRLHGLARQCYPMLSAAVSGELAKCDIAVLARYPNPHRLVQAGRTRLTTLIRKVSGGNYGADRAEAWLEVAAQAVALYGHDPAVAFDDIGAEIATQARVLELLEAERRQHADAREDAYQHADPQQLARSLPGVATIGGPVLVAAIENAERFPNAAAFKAFAGLAPKASETGDVDAKGQPISKAGASWLRDQLLQSANTARRMDPQLAAVYYRQMVHHGAHHQKALTVVAAKLAERFWAVMARGTPYVICDPDGTPVSRPEAKQIIVERFTVPEEIRAQRRSRKTSAKVRKAPQQVLTARVRSDARRVDKRGDLPHHPSSPPTSNPVNNLPNATSPTERSAATIST